MVFDFVKYGGGTPFTKLEETVGFTTFVAISSKPSANTADPVWAIYRETYLSPGATRTEWAENSVEQRFIWDSRASYFSPPIVIESDLCTEFNGTTQYVQIEDVELVARLGTTYSISLWFKGTPFDSSIRVLSSFRSTTSATPVWWYIQVGPSGSDVVSYCSIRDNAGHTTNITSSTPLTSGEWYHLVMVRNGNTIQLYLDAVLQGQGTASLGTITGPNRAVIGCNFNASTTPINFLDGRVDDFAVWQKALTAQDIAEIYNGGYRLDPKATTIGDQLICMLYMGDNDIYPTITDNSGFGNNGSMINMTAANFIQDSPPEAP